MGAFPIEVMAMLTLSCLMLPLSNAADPHAFLPPRINKSTEITNVTQEEEIMLSAAAIVDCASWCKYSPSSTWDSIPQCTACRVNGVVEDLSGGSDCARWCRYSPSDVWEDIPSCRSCFGRTRSIFGHGHWIWVLVGFWVLCSVCCCVKLF